MAVFTRQAEEGEAAMENAGSEFQGMGLQRLGAGWTKPSGGVWTRDLLGELQEVQ